MNPFTIVGIIVGAIIVIALVILCFVNPSREDTESNNDSPLYENKKSEQIEREIEVEDMKFLKTLFTIVYVIVCCLGFYFGNNLLLQYFGNDYTNITYSFVNLFALVGYIVFTIFVYRFISKKLFKIK